MKQLQRTLHVRHLHVSIQQSIPQCLTPFTKTNPIKNLPGILNITTFSIHVKNRSTAKTMQIKTTFEYQPMNDLPHHRITHDPASPECHKKTKLVGAHPGLTQATKQTQTYFMFPHVDITRD
ncbi:hypothetical protein JHK82_053351 [Glycine max]|uniref:Uncharacterized protein n=1 Tax=Glycine soja TaxID=3848 RepID=A0A445FFC1_GLYSO|nr:hypothetical protein JHK87_053272 [Glycine soja]KAG5085954.1 hypothetical protein JHK82_053351 [Glycine max]RZB47504.1 hypothetical protein D0Y65_051213 [Glycine soja]